MKLDIPFEQLLCVSCAKEMQRPQDIAGGDYAFVEVPVPRRDGEAPVKVPMQVINLWSEPRGPGRRSTKLIARVTCSGCGNDHTIDLSAVYRAPELHMTTSYPCRQCGQPMRFEGEPEFNYEDRGESGEFITLIGTMVCDQCHTQESMSSQLAASDVPRALETGVLELNLAQALNTTSTTASAGAQELLSIPLAREVCERPFKQFPMLHWAMNRLKQELRTPLSGLRVAFVLHFLTDLLPFAQACRELGLDPKNAMFFVKTHYPYPQKKAIQLWLEERGFEVQPIEARAAYIEKLEAEISADSFRLLIVEDGGYLTPDLHRRDSPLLDRTIGAVEQTTKGLRYVEQLGPVGGPRDLDGTLRFPLLSIPDSRIKTSIEPPLIGAEVVHCIQNLAPVSLHGLHVGLLGLGTIGMEVFRHLRRLGAHITGFDAASESRRAEFMMAGGFYASTPVEAVRGKRLVIGCSGKTSITPEVIENLAHGVYVASASSDRVEVDWEYLESRVEEKIRFGIHDAEVEPGKLWAGTRYILSGRPPREINLVADGYPVTFWGAPGMPHEGGDLIMTVILVAAAEVAARNGPTGQRAELDPYPSRICRKAVDDLGEKYRLQSQHLNLYYPESRVGT